MDLSHYASSLISLPPGHISSVWEHLGNESAELKQQLALDEELTATVFLFGGEQIFVDTFGYAGPNLLIVHGLLNGNKITAYVHQSCLQVVFAVVKKDPQKPRHQFGFVAEKERASEPDEIQGQQ